MEITRRQAKTIVACLSRRLMESPGSDCYLGGVHRKHMAELIRKVESPFGDLTAELEVEGEWPFERPPNWRQEVRGGDAPLVVVLAGEMQ